MPQQGDFVAEYHYNGGQIFLFSKVWEDSCRQRNEEEGQKKSGALLRRLGFPYIIS